MLNSRRWASIGIINMAYGLNRDLDDVDEHHAVTEVAMLASTKFNAAVVCLPGATSKHGYSEQWNIKGKAYVTAVFAAWNVPVVETEAMISDVTWYKDQMNTGIIMDTPKNVEIIAQSMLSFQRISNLFCKQLPGGVQCCNYQGGFTKTYDEK